MISTTFLSNIVGLLESEGYKVLSNDTYWCNPSIDDYTRTNVKDNGDDTLHVKIVFKADGNHVVERIRGRVNLYSDYKIKDTEQLENLIKTLQPKMTNLKIFQRLVDFDIPKI